MDLETRTALSLQVLACEVPEALGLTYAAGLLTGIAQQPGEHRLAVTCQDPDDPGAPTCRAVALLVVNADPRALWKDLASDRDALGWKPDTAAVRLPGAHDRQILLASRRGRSHAHIGALRDFIAPEVVMTAHLPRDSADRRLPCIATDRHALAVLIYMYLLYRHPLRGGKVHDPTRSATRPCRWASGRCSSNTPRI